MAKSVKDMVRQYERNRYAFSEFLGLAEPDSVQNVNRQPYKEKPAFAGFCFCLMPVRRPNSPG